MLCNTYSKNNIFLKEKFLLGNSQAKLKIMIISLLLFFFIPSLLSPSPRPPFLHSGLCPFPTLFPQTNRPFGPFIQDIYRGPRVLFFFLILTKVLMADNLIYYSFQLNFIFKHNLWTKGNNLKIFTLWRRGWCSILPSLTPSQAKLWWGTIMSLTCITLNLSVVWRGPRKYLKVKTLWLEGLPWWCSG